MRTWKLIVATLVIFAAGVATGTVVKSRQMNQARRVELDRRGSVPLAMWQRFESVRRAIGRLDLPQDQKVRIEGLIKESHARFQKLWEPLAPAARAELEQLRARVNAELGPDLRVRFEEQLRQRMPHRARSGSGTNGPSSAPTNESKTGPAFLGSPSGS